MKSQVTALSQIDIRSSGCYRVTQSVCNYDFKSLQISFWHFLPQQLVGNFSQKCGLEILEPWFQALDIFRVSLPCSESPGHQGLKSTIFRPESPTFFSPDLYHSLLCSYLSVFSVRI